MGKDLIKLLMSKLDPKWVPAIVAGVSLLFTIIYLIYTKKRLEEEKQVLKAQLAIAKSSGLDPLIEKSQEESMLAATESARLKKQIQESRDRISLLTSNAADSKAKLAKATSWGDLKL